MNNAIIKHEAPIVEYTIERQIAAFCHLLRQINEEPLAVVLHAEAWLRRENLLEETFKGTYKDMCAADYEDYGEFLWRKLIDQLDWQAPEGYYFDTSPDGHNYIFGFWKND